MRPQWLAIAAVVTFSCARATIPVELRVDSTQPGRPPAVASMAVPKGWRPMAPSASRAEYLGPDLRSRAYVRAMPGPPEPKRCQALEREYAAEVIDSWGKPPQIRVVDRTAGAEGIRFELRRLEQKPEGEVIWTRVVCREGVLAIASCAGRLAQEGALRPLCNDVLSSLRVATAPASPGAL